MNATDDANGQSERGPVMVWNQSRLVAEALESLKTGQCGNGRFVDGRLVRVEATPVRGTSSDMVVGVSALPPGFSSPEHHHRAEELAIVLHGTGSITVDGREFQVEQGDALLTPSDVPHVTTAGRESALVVMWVYAPPGSEDRWLAGIDTADNEEN